VVTLSRWETAPDYGDTRWIRVEEPSAVVGCRAAALMMAARLDFAAGRSDQLALAVTEAATNLVKHAREGSMLLRICRDTQQPRIELVTIDAGPGIGDLDAALRDGSSTAGSLGIGLGAIRRAADFCDIYSRPGRGTTLVARFLQAPPPPAARAATSWAGLTRSITGEAECGDSFAVSRGPA
jgi:anti-sigma regulatory factor (Ser/Thr protein kinase)